MAFLKNLMVSLFSFFLFLALSIFGFAFMLKSTALNPDFIPNEIAQLDMAALVDELVQIESPPAIPGLSKDIKTTIVSLEPKIEKQADTAIGSVYDYLLDKKSSPRLALTLRETFFSTDFVTSALDSIELAPLASTFLEKQLSQSLPLEVPDLDKLIADVIKPAEPQIKALAVAISGPVFDYYLLENATRAQTLASLEQAEKGRIEAILKPFLSLPEVAPFSPFLGQDFLNVVNEGIGEQLNDNLIQPGAKTSITEGIAAAEDGLAQAKRYVTYFRDIYTLLIIFIAVMAIGIILIVKNLKDVAHRLGIPLLTYGAIEYGGILVVKYLVSSGRIEIPSDFPASLHTWLIQLSNDLLRPLEIFSLAMLIVGLALTVVSFLYKHDQSLKWS